MPLSFPSSFLNLYRITNVITANRQATEGLSLNIIEFPENQIM